jgi:hypothetical protein
LPLGKGKNASDDEEEEEGKEETPPARSTVALPDDALLLATAGLYGVTVAPPAGRGIGTSPSSAAAE